MLAAAVLCVCAGAAAALPETASTQDQRGAIDPLFECYRVNTAWGFAMAGAMIDVHGNVFRFRSTGTDPRPAAAAAGSHDGYWPADALRSRFASLQASGNVDPNKVAENGALVVKAAAGKIARIETGVRDAGSSTCHAYLFDAAQQHYRDVVLGADEGVADFRLVNDAPEARQLIDWLRSVGVAN